MHPVSEQELFEFTTQALGLSGAADNDDMPLADIVRRQRHKVADPNL
jgi:hypothetical protein